MIQLKTAKSLSTEFVENLQETKFWFLYFARRPVQTFHTLKSKFKGPNREVKMSVIIKELD